MSSTMRSVALYMDSMLRLLLLLPTACRADHLAKAAHVRSGELRQLIRSKVPQVCRRGTLVLLLAVLLLLLLCCMCDWREADPFD